MENIILLGCGIIKKELEFLIQKNKLPVKAVFLDSTLHIHIDKLETSLKAFLQKHKTKTCILFYGACHPRMHKILESYKVVHVPYQNCIEMLISKDTFHDHLSQGAFFLMEDWIHRWEKIMVQAFGSTDPLIMQSEHHHMIAIRTVCSQDYTKFAHDLSHHVGLELHWMDVELDHLEKILLTAYNDAQKESHSQ